MRRGKKEIELKELTCDLDGYDGTVLRCEHDSSAFYFYNTRLIKEEGKDLREEVNEKWLENLTADMILDGEWAVYTWSD